MSERDRQLWDRVKHHRFWCETCHGWHPLLEHAACRNVAVAAVVAGARHAITPREDPHVT